VYRDWAAAIKAWMEDEEGLYDWNNPGFTHETGHFTQVVSHVPCCHGTWASSTCDMDQPLQCSYIGGMPLWHSLRQCDPSATQCDSSASAAPDR
jgi:hypothetical protein